MVMVRTWIEPVVAGAQLASSFYDTGLLMVVKNNYNHTNSSSNSSTEDALQKAISNFYIIYNLILGLTPLLSAYILAKIGDKKNRKIPICVPLGGYLISRLLLLFVILLDWPIEVMYGSAALNGLTGWFTVYWAGIMALASLGSSESGRSLRLIVIELVYGLAGFVGSLASGHIFIRFTFTNHEGTVLVSSSIALYALCLMYSLFVLKIPHFDGPYHNESRSREDVDRDISERHNGLDTKKTENSRLLGERPDDRSTANTNLITVIPSKVIIALLFTSGILYNVAVSGAVDVLPLYLLKKPLSWGPVDIGYGNAAGYLIFISSFLGVYVFSKYLSDLTMILIGIISFCAGIFIMAFVKWTFLYYVARAVMLFSLIPLPTIRSVLSKHVQGSSYGKVFVLLQLSLAVSGVITSTAFNKIYQATLDMYSGFCFVLSGIIAVVSILPISIAAYKHLSRVPPTSNERHA
ncbi:solute carrier family 46 member 2-like isoform X2 [Ascaphus truei]|uniref:solute carrier family 46 member 2-like isoform X2 n=1 Tax=Ascaphus truei TaxID=8439 RepID=UPI003F59BB51